ncbi:hypothetical protein [Halobaculum sp. D14]|uniref:hypothetical protein n=1 Tax=unclassified Halobaculum TaxID=2640896 RepID=UPI003EBE18AD
MVVDVAVPSADAVGGAAVAALTGSAAEATSAAAGPDYRALLFAATFLALLGVLCTLHGGAAYAILVWEGSAGVAAWHYVDPRLGAFFFVAAAFQFPLAAHLWGDPLRLRRATGRLLRAALDR